MRRLANAERIERFLEQLGESVQDPARLYLVGGATAVLHGWRDTTVDIDVELVPDSDELLRAIQRLKNELEINVESSAPHHFIPELSGWRERSLFVGDYGPIAVFHYDPYSQAMAKLERGHAKDLDDVQAMARVGLIERARLLELFEGIEERLFRFPAIDPGTFRRAVETFARHSG